MPSGLSDFSGLVYIPEPELTDELVVGIASRPDSGWPEFTTLGDIADFFAATTPTPGGGGVASISGTFSADGSFSTALPAVALITAATVVANTFAGATISLGTTSGGSDILGPTVIAGGGPTGVQGISFLQNIFGSAQVVFAHSAAWGSASITITIWYFGPPSAASGLYNNGGLLGVTDNAWPTTSAGAPGSVWSNSGVASVVPGYTPIAGAPVFFGQISSTQLLALGARGLPTTSPSIGSQQLWVLNNEILVA